MPVKIHKKRDYRPHSEALNGAYVLLQLSEEKRDGCYYEWMGSLLLSAFAYEGYLNFLGRKLFPSWESFERGLSWQSKTKLIADRIDLTIDEGAKPFQTVRELFAFRDRIAHPKPDELIEEFETTNENLWIALHGEIKSKEEKFCSVENTRLCMEQVQKMMELLFERAKSKVKSEGNGEDGEHPFEWNAPLFPGGQSGSTCS